VLSLPPTLSSYADYYAYEVFFNDFGISIVDRVLIGGRAIKYSIVDPDWKERTLEDFSSDLNVTFYGGDTDLIHQSIYKFDDWVNTVPDYPVPIHRTFQPISTVIQPELFDKSVDSDFLAAVQNNLNYIFSILIPADYEVMFTDGSVRRVLLGQHIYAPDD